ncbi:hypothetical protein OLL86_03745 [Gallibacterium anatis]|uniref:hypothetical protein n=1 Tax=Gallibacterium anatis TaxID=750 RepID=UPI00222F10BA|nr:hypothetical protein [Gallibacterium anatis]UZD16658.1 hypothetical protein OLL86_03745 [Gallibacterium anatis]
MHLKNDYTSTKFYKEEVYPQLDIGSSRKFLKNQKIMIDWRLINLNLYFFYAKIKEKFDFMFCNSDNNRHQINELDLIYLGAGLNLLLLKVNDDPNNPNIDDKFKRIL